MEEKTQKKANQTSRHTPYAIRHTRGFTLIEMIVATALFAVVMVVCVGALLSLVSANRKAQALQSVMNNLNIALDGTVRSVRMGSDYDAGSAGCTVIDPLNPHDCAEGSTQISFKPFGDPLQSRWVYRFNSTTHQLERSTTGSIAGAVPITAPEVSIDSMLFYVIGTQQSDTVQPKVVIVIKGSAGASGTTAHTTFHIQATAVQRVLDL
ncbi:type II secretion system protein [Candidatus Kaiserbacteria bacterium]|nr:type II secretion system protein [Candidatus Kaiserbacteria bacterium]